MGVISMKTIAFDPGTVFTGWSVFIDGEPISNGKFRAVSGWVQSKRLGYIFTQVIGLLREEQPDMIGIEEQHVGKNAKTSLITARALGIIISAAGMCDIPVYEFKPSEVKKAVTGDGSSSKEEVAIKLLEIYSENECVQNIGSYLDTTIHKTDDIYDAVGINHALKVLGITRTEGTKKKPIVTSRAI